MAANNHTRHYFNVIQCAIVFGVFNSSYHVVIIRFIVNDARKLLRLTFFFFELLQHSCVGTYLLKFISVLGVLNTQWYTIFSLVVYIKQTIMPREIDKPLLFGYLAIVFIDAS